MLTRLQLYIIRTIRFEGWNVPCKQSVLVENGVGRKQETNREKYLHYWPREEASKTAPPRGDTRNNSKVPSQPFSHCNWLWFCFRLLQKLECFKGDVCQNYFFQLYSWVFGGVLTVGEPPYSVFMGCPAKTTWFFWPLLWWHLLSTLQWASQRTPGQCDRLWHHRVLQECGWTLQWAELSFLYLSPGSGGSDGIVRLR